jgi:large subunit ribosomal protein L10e
MARKPARMYRRLTGQAYTRREYMGGVPALRINTFDLGVTNGDFPITINMKVEEACEKRDTAMEAARIAANRVMSKTPGGNYHLKFRIYPHHVLRENKLATGAGADRVSSGMRNSFGKNIGTAARVHAGQVVLTIRVPASNFNSAKEALWKASLKLPTPCFIEVEKGAELVK